MKLTITIELDKDSSQSFKTAVVDFSKQINDLIGLIGKTDFYVEEITVPEPEPAPVLKPAKPAAKKKKSKPKKSNLDTLLNAIKKHKDGISFKELQQKTGLTGKQISDNAYRLKKENKIEKREDGMFVAL